MKELLFTNNDVQRELNRLKRGDFDELVINAGQGIMYDEDNEELWLISFHDKAHDIIKTRKVISDEVAKNNMLRFWNRDIIVASRMQIFCQL